MPSFDEQPPETKRTIARIVKVNHAGEYGAIRIYKAQRFVCGLFYRDLTAFLDEFLGHEVEHCRRFREAVPARQARPCRTMWLWSLGGFVLGFVTALMGRNMVMVCTEAVEDTVHHHMNDQIKFLSGRDDALKDLIEDIKVEELAHLDYAQERVRHNGFTKFIARIICALTEVIIWLSTHGDLSRLKRDLAGAS